MNTSADKRFRVAIIGAGRMSQVMIDSLKMASDISVVAVASRDRERANFFAKKNRIPVYYGSYDELIRSDGFDLIYVATVNSTHYDIACKCLENKKPILVEKPVCLSLPQTRSLVELSKKNNTFLAEAMPLRYSPNMKRLQAYIQSGAMGNSYLMSSNIGIKNWGIDRICRKELGGGALFDIGVYGLTLADMVFVRNELLNITS